MSLTTGKVALGNSTNRTIVTESTGIVTDTYAESFDADADKWLDSCYSVSNHRAYFCDKNAIVAMDNTGATQVDPTTINANVAGRITSIDATTFGANHYLIVGCNGNVDGDEVVYIFNANNLVSLTVASSFLVSDMWSNGADDATEGVRAVAIHSGSGRVIVGGNKWFDYLDYDSGSLSWNAQNSDIEDGATVTGVAFVTGQGDNIVVMQVVQNGTQSGAAATDAYLYRKDTTGTQSDIYQALGTGETDAVGSGHNIGCLKADRSGYLAAKWARKSVSLVSDATLAVSFTKTITGADFEPFAWRAATKFRYAETGDSFIKEVNLVSSAWTESSPNILPSALVAEFSDGTLSLLNIAPNYADPTDETDYIARAFDNGGLVGQDITTSAGSFGIPIPAASLDKPLLVVVSQKERAYWQATNAYALNDQVIPTSAKTDWWVVVCTTAGASAGTEPDWSVITAVGDTVTDNTVVWTVITALVKPIANYPETLAS